MQTNKVKPSSVRLCFPVLWATSNLVDARKFKKCRGQNLPVDYAVESGSRAANQNNNILFSFIFCRFFVSERGAAATETRWPRKNWICHWFLSVVFVSYPSATTTTNFATLHQPLIASVQSKSSFTTQMVYF